MSAGGIVPDKENLLVVEGHLAVVSNIFVHHRHTNANDNILKKITSINLVAQNCNIGYKLGVQLM